MTEEHIADGIHVAAAAADADTVARLLAADPARATRPDAMGRPPLVHACASGSHAGSPALAVSSLRVVTLLLDAGADVNTSIPVPEGEDGGRVAALYFACESNNLPVVRLLLERGANPNDGESTYHAAQRGHLECLELLKAHGANLSDRHPHWNNTPLYFLAGHHDDEGGAAPWVRGFGWLLDHGADPNVTSYDAREAPLHKTVTSIRNTVATALLVKHGADVNLPRADGRTPYVAALRAGNQIAMAMLEAHGARVDAVAPMDALIGALVRGDASEAARLAAAQPDWRSRLTPEDRGLPVQSVWSDRPDAIRLMVSMGFDLSWPGEWAGTPLHHAAWLGKADLVRLLISRGAPVDERDARFGSSPIAWAAHGSSNCRTADDEYCAVVDVLIDAGASWAASINKENESPDALATPAVAARFAARGFRAV